MKYNENEHLEESEFEGMSETDGVIESETEEILYDDEELMEGSSETDGSDEVMELSEDEIEETKGGSGGYRGFVKKSTNGQTAYMPEVMKRVGAIERVTWTSNPILAKADYTPNIFVVNKTKSVGTAQGIVYGKNGWVRIIVTFTGGKKRSC